MRNLMRILQKMLRKSFGFREISLTKPFCIRYYNVYVKLFKFT